jgi:hypothetical protein
VHARTTTGLRLIGALHDRVPSPAGNKAITVIRGRLSVQVSIAQRDVIFPGV